MMLRRWILDDLEQIRFSHRITAGAVAKARWTERPRPDANSVAFLVWHMARWHDLSVNLFVRNVETVYERGWMQQLGLDPAPGTGFTSDQVDELGALADPEILEAYFNAVLDETETWLNSIDDPMLGVVLEEVIDTDARWRGDERLLPPSAAWVVEFQRGWTGAQFLRWTAIGHLYWHFGELQTVTSELGHPLR